MNKFTLVFISSLLIIGCGGGGGEGNTNSGGTVFKYPSFFNEYKIFKASAELRSSISSLPIAQADLLVFRDSFAQAVITDMAIRTSLQLIDDTPSHSRASCEKGTLNITSYSDAPPSGVFEMSNFSGVGINVNGDEDCPISYYDGYINYSITNHISTATFGNYNSSGTPFFSGSGGQFNATTGVLGSLSLEETHQESVVFTTGANKSLEIFIVESDIESEYTKGPYTKFNSVILKNATISSIINSGRTTLNANYTREWEDEGKTFILITEIRDIVSDTDTGEILAVLLSMS